MYHVYSTLTASTVYTPCLTKDAPSGFKFNEKTERILIMGGSNCAHLPKQGGALYTPQGIVTTVTDEQMDALKYNYHFREHVKNGFIRFEKKKVAVEKGIADLEEQDKSAPITPKSLPKGVEEAEGPDGKKPGKNKHK